MIPLSFAQRRLWFLQQFEGPATTYNLPMVLRLTGELDEPALEQALRDVVSRHESLRTVLPETAGLPEQRILAPEEVGPLLTVERVAEGELTARLELAASHCFDLTTEMPVRMWLLKTAPHDHRLMLLMHHVAADGGSLGPLAADLATAYAARREGHAPGWAPLGVQYADYTLWQREVLGDEDDPQSLISEQAEFWRRTLAGLPDQIELPADRARPAHASTRGDSVERTFDAALQRALTGLANDHRVSLFMVLQAAVAVLLTRLGAGTDVPIGTPVAGRSDEALDDLVGFFVNTLVLRTDTSGDPTFAELLHRVRDAGLAAYANADLPFERLVELINPTRSLARHPLFQVMLILQNNARPELDFPGLVADLDGVDVRSAKVDLSFDVEERFTGDGRSDGLRVDLEFATDLYDAATAELILARLEAVLRAVAANPQLVVTDLDVVSETERRQVLSGWNDTAGGVPAAGLAELFEARVAAAPDAVSVMSGERSTTYGELDRRAGALAAELVSRGAGPEAFIAVALPRTELLALALLAVAKTGAAYVPIDIHYPTERIAWIMDDTTPVCVVTTRALAPTLRVPPGIHIVELDPDAPPPGPDRSSGFVSCPGDPSHPAYVIHTSGSTGKPKGVIVTNAGLINFLTAMQNQLTLTPHDRVLALTTIAFDIAALEIHLPLVTGASVIIAADDEVGEPARLARLIQVADPTIIQATPSLWQDLITHHADVLTGRRLLTGGEAVPRPLADQLARAGAEVINLYGPTETTIWSTSDRITGDGAAAVPIGRPILNTRVYVLDARLHPQPPGVPGDLYIAGHGLARGYLHQAALTGSRFVADPFSPGGRLYRTGDLAAWDRDGRLVYLGRSDHQVKLRGHRIELTEIENTLTSHVSVGRAVVVLREDRPGDQRLIAYVVPAAGVPADSVDATELRSYAGRFVPRSMVPAAVVVLGALPLTPNGKLDRAALPAPGRNARPAHRPPRDAREAVLCGVFGEVLGLTRVGVDEDFFELGGHSLLAMRLTSRIGTAFGVQIAVRDLFDAPTVATLAARLDTAEVAGAAHPALTAVPRPDRLPLSSAQRRLWFLHRLEGPGPTYNVPALLHLSGPLDIAALEAAFADVTARHESLRTVFPDVDGRTYQHILAPEQARPVLEVADLGPGGDLRTAVASAAAHAFDLMSEIPFRAWLFRTAEQEHALLILAHHIASDGWSFAPLARDLSAAYASRRLGQAPGWAPLPVQYADYTLWQQKVLGEEDDPDSVVARQIDHWRSALAGLPDRIDLPADRSRAAVAGYEGAAVAFEWDADLHAGLARLARAHQVSVFMVLQAGIAALLSRLGAGTDVPIGTPVAGRTDEALDDLVGFFVNTLVLRTDVGGDPAFAELLGRVRETDLAAYAHQGLPFERLVDLLNPARTLTHHPLFQVMLVLQNQDDGDFTMPGLEVRPQEVGTGAARLDLTFNLEERHTLRRDPAGLSGTVEFATDLFDAATARTLAERLERLLRSAVRRPDLPVSRLDVLAGDERELLLAGWNDTTHDDVTVATLPALFEAQVRRTPRAPALEEGDVVLSYAELDARVNHLAHDLIAAGAGPERIVALILPRSIDLVVHLLATLKAGAAYLPIDPAHPRERIENMLADAGPVLTVTRELIREPAGSSTHAPTDDDRIAPLHPEHPAYVIYTSGSTGRPKGVVVAHSGMGGFAADKTERCGIEPGDRVLQGSSPSFDASVLEMWTALLSGACLVVPPAAVLEHDVLAGEALSGVLRDLRINHAVTSPAALASVPPVALPQLRSVVVGGDAFSGEVAARWATGRRLFNGYGPTEGTVWVTSSDPLTGTEEPPIGSPVWNTRAYVLDGVLQPVPVGVVGELYIAGRQLARGYLGCPELTASRFVACPFAPFDRMYRTGDLVRRRADGQLEFSGRADTQVKVRGHRIELGEIEATLSAVPGVGQAAAIVREDRPGDKRIVAYVSPAGGGGTAMPDVAQLRAWLTHRLPAVMIPAAFVVLDRLPLTVSSKLDVAAVPAPDFAAVVGGEGPRSPREEVLCDIVAEVLGLDRVGVHDSFFELGGDSISSIEVVSRSRRAGLVLSARQVFQHQDVASLAAVALELPVAGPAVDANAPDDGIGTFPATPVMHWLREIGSSINGFNQSVVVRVPVGLGLEDLRAAIQALVDHHDVLRLQIEESGPERWRLAVRPVGAVNAETIVRRAGIAGLTGPARDECMGREGEQARARLRPHEGVVLQVVWFDAGPHTAGCLLLVAHHLVVDGVSWRILLPDLAAAGRAVAAGRTATLERPITSFRTWAHGLTVEAARSGRIAELPAWQEILRAPEPLLGARPIDPSRDLAADTQSLTLTLDADVTSPLLTTVPAQFHAGVDDVLLTGLARAVAGRRSAAARRTSGTDVLIDLEGHGREDVVPGTDVGSTVGWFTAVHPVRIDAGGPDEDLARAVKRVKEQLRAVPDRGLGYGLLRYLNDGTASALAGLAQPQIGFNYLGRFSVDAVSERDGMADWALLTDVPVPEGHDPAMPVTMALMVNALTEDRPDGPRLTATWTWAADLLSEADVHGLAKAWSIALTELAALGSDQGVVAGHTPSDLTLDSLSQDEIDDIEAELELM